MLQRKIIKQDFEPRYASIITVLEVEMDNTKYKAIIHYLRSITKKVEFKCDLRKGFDEQISIYEAKNEVIVHRNMPKVSGALQWCQELKTRVTKPLEMLKKSLDHPVIHSDEMDRTEKKYHELIIMIDEFAKKIYAEWCAHVGQLSDNNLEKNLIYRDFKTKSIKTNFDPQVIGIL